MRNALILAALLSAAPAVADPYVVSSVHTRPAIGPLRESATVRFTSEHSGTTHLTNRLTEIAVSHGLTAKVTTYDFTGTRVHVQGKGAQAVAPKLIQEINHANDEAAAQAAKRRVLD